MDEFGTSSEGAFFGNTQVFRVPLQFEQLSQQEFQKILIIIGKAPWIWNPHALELFAVEELGQGGRGGF